jgi:hypothetical protein
VHPFCLSPEEKRPSLELSMEGRPWPDFELHDQACELIREVKEGGGGRRAGAQARLAVGR